MQNPKSSFTAFVVLSSLAKLARMPRWRSCFTNEAIQMNQALLAHTQDTLLRRLVNSVPPGFSIWLMDRLFVPGMTQHFLFRKALIETQVERAIAEGTAQFIVLGAGLDPLALRMTARYPQIRFFEIDLPQTQATKRRAIAQGGFRAAANCIFVPADLAVTKLRDALSPQAEFDASLPTFIVIEGVLMYLQEAAVRALFTQLRELFSAQLEILFGATVSSDAEGHLPLKIINDFLAKNHEPTAWHCPSRAMQQFMEGLGFEVQAWMPYKELQRIFRTSEDVRNIPEEDENYYLVAKKSLGTMKASVTELEQISFITVKS